MGSPVVLAVLVLADEVPVAAGEAGTPARKESASRPSMSAGNSHPPDERPSRRKSNPRDHGSHWRQAHHSGHTEDRGGNA
ncbi:hypothetical protein Veis_3719 [Verminephrobacter eiseniae EF01-2]|uniref:Uncharacterized protein n=1 Tax=Verminephrobacter eiseniae (strain EF01-2) TaxID=391735 RepID=A1WP77_VEREI|nr:hypothetical protein Veis_3719 [Verminephrobacter eiseniae EF01-2]MCW5284957.1 hypothetical protein [Verminephrobacter eiseniae]MCW5302665.1 hypothetical protein [Verminephrobacter eiseniae]MCW8189006.1 hypothetical protein [Verminephrobacter eiseniae]